jgi:signal transduction histidine kinase
MHLEFSSHEEASTEASLERADALAPEIASKRTHAAWYDPNDAQFTTQLLRKQEEERHDLAKELQDTIAQLLIAAQMHLDHGQKYSADPHPSFADARKLLATAMQEIRVVVNRLYPQIIEYYGTMAALQFMCMEFSREQHIPIRCTARGASRTAHKKQTVSGSTVQGIHAGIMLYRALQLLLTLIEQAGVGYIDNMVVVFITQKQQLSLRVVVHHHTSLVQAQEMFGGLRSYIRAAGGAMRLAFFTEQEIHVTMHIPILEQPTGV